MTLVSPFNLAFFPSVSGPSRHHDKGLPKVQLAEMQCTAAIDQVNPRAMDNIEDCPRQSFHFQEGGYDLAPGRRGSK